MIIRNEHQQEAYDLNLALHTMFVIYIVKTSRDREELIETLKSHTLKRDMVFREISIIRDDVDGPVIVENGAYHHDIPTWWHSEAFFTVVHDLEKVALDLDKYPKFSRLVGSVPGSAVIAPVTRKLPSDSTVRAVICEDELVAVDRMICRLGQNAQGKLTAFRVKKNDKGYWSRIETFADRTVEILENVLKSFCADFIEHPYRCYTEHGQHALFYSMLYNALPANSRDLKFKDFNVCAIQKEYPTFSDLGKPRRQNWDISIIRNPANSTIDKESFDYLDLLAVVEFGLNENIEHLVDDFLRVSHPKANAEYRYIVHLYRLSDAGDQISGRDWSANAKEVKQDIKSGDLLKYFELLSTGDRAIKDEKVQLELVNNRSNQRQTECKPVTIFYGYVDVSKKNPEKLLYRISNGKAEKIGGNP